MALFEAVSAQIEASGASGSALAELALAYAERIDSGEDTGAGTAALGRHLADVLQLIGADESGVELSPLDEVRARREAKRASS